ncbi:MAG: DUF2167 domain-containing protein [Flavobacteriales bacterium]|nr:DUF2167 domain-containing protein [Flavobacteriales bacterium]
MKQIFTVVLFLSAFTFLSAQDEMDTSAIDMEAFMAEYQLAIDSVEKTFTYQHGEVELPGSNATLVVPAGFGYLDPEQAKRVLEELWGNPPASTLGLLVADGGVMGENSWAFDITYDEIGYVEDDDAADTDYDELLVTMKQDIVEENKMRVKEGYPEVTMHGWASKPFYDPNLKVLHWAKDVAFADAEYHTLNYNVRILGRKGVMVLNAIGRMDQLQSIASTIPHVMTSLKFKDGFQYKDYDSDVDEVAAYTIGGLVAGKILAKAGLFAVFAKFGKLIFIGLAAVGAGIWNRIRNRKKRELPAIQESSGPEQVS